MLIRNVSFIVEIIIFSIQTNNTKYIKETDMKLYPSEIKTFPFVVCYSKTLQVHCELDYT